MDAYRYNGRPIYYICSECLVPPEHCVDEEKHHWYKSVVVVEKTRSGKRVPAMKIGYCKKCRDYDDLCVCEDDTLVPNNLWEKPEWCNMAWICGVCGHKNDQETEICGCTRVENSLCKTEYCPHGGPGCAKWRAELAEEVQEARAKRARNE